MTVTANVSGELVQGGVVTFTAPSSNASTNPAVTTATIAANGQASDSVTADSSAGAFAVTPSVAGAVLAGGPNSFSLTITPLPPSVTVNTTKLGEGATTIVITGSNFDANPANDSVAFNMGVAGAVSSVNAAGTQMTVTFTSPPTTTGALDATVTNGAGSSSSTQVATIIPSSYVVTSTADSGPNTLRNAIDTVAGIPGAYTLTFAGAAAALGATITLTGNDTNNPTAFGPRPW